MSERQNVKTVEAIYAAFGRGDLPFIVNTLAADDDWNHPRPDIPWGGRRTGRGAVAQFFDAVAAHVEIEEFVPEQFVSSGDEVIVFGRERGRTRSIGCRYEVNWAHAWTFHGGTVVKWREYTDTATIVDALIAVPAASR